MSDTKSEKCANCRWFDVDDATRYWLDRHSDCRRRAPVAEDGGKPVWPVVGCHDWCGDFERYVKPPEDVREP